MKAWVLEKTGELTENSAPLRLTELPDPEPGPGEVRIKVSVCGICHTELDEIEGRTAPPKLPVVPGHQIVGLVDKAGPEGTYAEGSRVGVGWIYDSCGACDRCRAGSENLCEDFSATGRDADGGYAEYVAVPGASAYPIPKAFSDEEAAPLLCAGAIGYRSLRLTNMYDGMILGLTGFGSSAHIVLQIARYLYPESRVFVFARRKETREFARSLGAAWAGGTEDTPPEQPDCIIDTTPAWVPVIRALEVLRPGGRLVINAIRKEERDKKELLRLSYHEHLWMEKEIKSVANITRKDIRDFLPVAAAAGIRPEVETVAFEDANRALVDMKFKGSRGARVLSVQRT
jgi:propanol-preferring alcohol dehydrogenase